MFKHAQQEQAIIQAAYMLLRNLLFKNGIVIELHDDFERYTTVRRKHGDHHLNQAFDPRHVTFGSTDFWVMAENRKREPVATYCLRRFIVDDFFDVIRSLELWFDDPTDYRDQRFVVDCGIPPFGGEVVHGGGLWVRPDYRGVSRLAVIMPQLARIFALRQRPFDHDTAMIRDEPTEPAEAAGRKAIFMGIKVYGFARVHPFVNGWFPPEGRTAVMHLCHATRAEAIASLARAQIARQTLLRGAELGQSPLVYQHYQPVYASAVLSQRQQQAGV